MTSFKTKFVYDENIRKKAKSIVMSFYDELMLYVEHRMGMSVSEHTYTKYRKNLTNYFYYLLSTNKIKLGHNRESFVGFAKFVTEVMDFAASTYIQQINSVTTYLRMEFQKGNIEPFSLELPKVYINKEKIKSRHPVIPVFEDIVEIRKKRISLLKAMGFECLISSGLRINEMAQIRYCDLDLERKPWDNEENCFSKYTGCQVKLSLSVHTIKDGKNRITYFSNSALRLIKILMNIIGIDDWKSRNTVWPFEVNTLKDMIASLNDIHRFGSQRHKMLYDDKDMDVEVVRILSQIKEEEKKMDRSPVLSRSKISKLKQQLKLLDKSSPLRKKNSILAKRGTTGRFSAHGTRHFAGAFLYFRSFDGFYSDILRSRQFLGHKTEMMTINYMDELNVVHSKGEWIKIMNGEPMNYRNIYIDRSLK